MRRRRNVKILATLGPASANPHMARALYEAGADVFRINMSHTSAERVHELVHMLRVVEAEVERPIGILADLQGPKLRIGTLKHGPLTLTEGMGLVLDLNPEPGDGNRIPLPHPEVFEAVTAGDVLLVDDGKVRLRVTEMRPGEMAVVVEVGTRISDRKGVNVPGAVLPIPALTAKDRVDLAAAVDAGVDWIALSFVQRPEDVAEAKKLVGGRAAILSKIEKPAAITKLEEIIDLSDALMVARGDLGVELPIEEVPGRQKQITRACRKAGKPVVVATQMLESMIQSPSPTRAEVSDVATAVFEGADAIMLSAETAAGQFPIEAVTVMDRVAMRVETDPYYAGIIDAQRADPEPTTADAISAAANQIAHTIRASAIACWTGSGSTARRLARERPGLPIVALTPVLSTARRLALVWGLHCVTTDDAQDLDDVVDRACRIAFREGFARPNDRLVITAGVPLQTPGTTNFLRVALVGRSGGDGV